jgi:prophage regulatory protein
MSEVAPPLTVLRRKQVERIVGLSRSQIYALAKLHQFPKPIRLGARAVGWLSSEIDAWLADRIAASRAS